MRHNFPLYLILLSLLFSKHVMAESSATKVVVTIKPLYSLVASLMKGAGEPVLLISGNASPHHYSLKPSERRRLSEASLLFWIGPRLESFLPRMLDSLNHRPLKLVELSQSEGLLRLPSRNTAHDEHAGEENNAAEQEDNIDPHIWLHTGNLKVMAREITRQLIKHSPEHRFLYEKNHQQLQLKIDQLHQELQQSFTALQQGYISYHDAYQYIEHQFELNQRGIVSPGENIKPGARHISQLRKIIKQENIQCLFYDAPTRPRLLNTLLGELDTNAYAIDASGQLLEATEDSLFQALSTLAQTFKKCLSVSN